STFLLVVLAVFLRNQWSQAIRNTQSYHQHNHEYRMSQGYRRQGNSPCEMADDHRVRRLHHRVAELRNDYWPRQSDGTEIIRFVDFVLFKHNAITGTKVRLCKGFRGSV